MISKLKLVYFAIFMVVIVISYLTGILGKKYDPSQDFICCKGQQLYLHHYYKIYFFGLNAGTSYKIEAVGKAGAGGCNVQCE